MASAWRPLRVIIGARIARCMRFRLKPKSFLDDSRRDWQFAAFGWLLRNCGGYPKFLDTTLVLPTEKYFPDRGMKGHAAVAALFRRVRDHAGMADWPCTVEPESETPRIATDESGRMPVFSYRRDTLEPIALVAHFSREFARYLITTIEEPAPGGDELREAAVELGAVFFGFGVFMMNSAVKGARYQLSEGELAHALALFCLLRRLPPDSGDAHLNPHLRKHVRLAARDLAQHEPRFERLRSLPARVPEEEAKRESSPQAS
jgi:hypothetical protein